MSKHSLLLAAALIWGTTASWGQSAKSPSAELPSGEAKQKVESACLRCHAAEIIVQQRLDRKLWTSELEKMIRWGAVVDSGDINSFVDYLSTNFGTDRPKYVARRMPVR
jgi:hypothetical protein